MLLLTPISSPSRTPSWAKKNRLLFLIPYPVSLRMSCEKYTFERFQNQPINVTLILYTSASDVSHDVTLLDRQTVEHSSIVRACTMSKNWGMNGGHIRKVLPKPDPFRLIGKQDQPSWSPQYTRATRLNSTRVLARPWDYSIMIEWLHILIAGCQRSPPLCPRFWESPNHAWIMYTVAPGLITNSLTMTRDCLYVTLLPIESQ